MAMNMVRTGTCAVAGVASGVLSSGTIQPLNLGGQVVSWAAIAETVALLGGAALQFMSPFTAPSLADGLVDGGAALLAARATAWGMSQTQGNGNGNGAAALARRSSPLLANRPMTSNPRAAIGGGSKVPKYQNV